MHLQENTLFANRYELIKLLGRGGFSEVWLAKDNWTHLKIALKVYAPGQGMDANGLQEFCGELASVYDLNHSNLLKPQHVDTWENMPYLIMAYCSEGSCSGKVGQMSEDAMWKFILDVASGLAYLHSKDVVHQDIKPDNILVDDGGNYLITDFGVSTRARSTLRKSVVSSAVGGTTAYMGPERFSHQPAPTKASDIWSFGAMCFELLEGEVPFGDIGGGMQKGGAEIPFIQANVSDALKFTIIKMLQKETWDRPTAETLVGWAKNPSAIVVDRTLFEDAPVNETHQSSISGANATQRFGAGGGVGQETQRFGTSSSVKKDKEPLKLTVSPSLITTVPGEGGNQIVYVFTNAKDWELEKCAEWIHLEEKKDSHFTLRFDQNKTGKTRECLFGVLARRNDKKGGEYVPIKVSQVSLPRDNTWVKWLVGIVSAILVIVGISKCSAIQSEKETLRANHAYFVSEFDKDLSAATIDNIEALEDAYDDLEGIWDNEHAARYDGNNVYPYHHDQLEQKVIAIYNEVDGKYNRAPAGSNIERKLLQKRKKIQELKNKL